MAVMDGYVRVSQVGDRDGDSYRSPVIQAEEIERWAKNNGVTIGKILTDEDVSGPSPVAQRKLEKLIQRAERGESAGVIVHRADRFGRDHNETLKAAKRLKDAEARLVGVADGVDSDQPHGKWILNFMSLQAEDYLDRVRSNWDAAGQRAVAEGKHIASKAPIGYLRADEASPIYDSGGDLVRDARLIVDPEKAPAILTMFEMRAAGKSYAAISDFLEEQLGKPFAKSTLGGMLRNRAYLGEARGFNDHVKPGAHVAIVPPDLFAKTQPKSRGYVPRNGSLAEQALLAGVVTCGGCGHKMRTLGTTDKKTGKRVANYVCSARYSDGRCEAPAAASVKLVDEFVVTRFQDDELALSSAKADAERRYLLAKEAVAKADADLDEWVTDEDDNRGLLGKDRYQQGIVDRQARLDAAKREMWDAEEDGAMEDGEVMFAGTDEPIVYSLWGEDKARDRRLLKRYIRSVSVTKADPKRRRWQPIAERVHIEWITAEVAA